MGLLRFGDSFGGERERERERERECGGGVVLVVGSTIWGK